MAEAGQIFKDEMNAFYGVDNGNGTMPETSGDYQTWARQNGVLGANPPSSPLDWQTLASQQDEKNKDAADEEAWRMFDGYMEKAENDKRLTLRQLKTRGVALCGIAQNAILNRGGMVSPNMIKAFARDYPGFTGGQYRKGKGLYLFGDDGKGGMKPTGIVTPPQLLNVVQKAKLGGRGETLQKVLWNDCIRGSGMTGEQLERTGLHNPFHNYVEGSVSVPSSVAGKLFGIPNRRGPISTTAFDGAGGKSDYYYDPTTIDQLTGMPIKYATDNGGYRGYKVETVGPDTPEQEAANSHPDSQTSKRYAEGKAKLDYIRQKPTLDAQREFEMAKYMAALAAKGKVTGQNSANSSSSSKQKDDRHEVLASLIKSRNEIRESLGESPSGADLARLKAFDGVIDGLAKDIGNDVSGRIEESERSRLAALAELEAEKKRREGAGVNRDGEGVEGGGSVAGSNGWNPFYAQLTGSTNGSVSGSEDKASIFKYIYGPTEGNTYLKLLNSAAGNGSVGGAVTSDEIKKKRAEKEEDKDKIIFKPAFPAI